MRVDDMEDLIVETLGYEDAFKNLSQALSTDVKEEMYEYIIRMHDITGDD